MSKNILGLDLGTNSIGWALINRSDDNTAGTILGAGSRIIPMSQDILGKFDSGVSISQTAERTHFRGVRRLRERHLLRRERLHRVLNIIGFLPKHYANEIDFSKNTGQFYPSSEPKIAYALNNDSKTYKFLFKESFEEMMKEFRFQHPELLENNKKIPYDWTIYYLRKKAITEKIQKEELAWLLLHFNQKRGYFQLRGEEEETEENKLVEYYSLKVLDVLDSGDKKSNNETWYNVVLENGWIYRRTSKTPLDWVGKIKDFIVTSEINLDGSIKKGKDGNEKRSFRSPAEGDWTLVKKKTEYDIEKSQKTVGEFIYESLLKDPSQKIKGKLVRTIERKFYKQELKTILEAQIRYHNELNNEDLYRECLIELYRMNEGHRNILSTKNFLHLFLEDIIFYQRPLKSKKSLISNCRFEFHKYFKNGTIEIQPLKGIPKSHPLFQEFRLLKFLQNLRILQKEKEINGKLETDVDVTTEFLSTVDKWNEIFDWLNEKKEIDQKALLKYPGFALKKNTENYRWNYVEDKTYPCNETRYLISTRLNQLNGIDENFLDEPNLEQLWHILYSVEDKSDIVKALKTFSDKKALPVGFVEKFTKFPPFKKEYGSYSSKAIKKLLPLMRIGKYWTEDNIHPHTKDRIQKIITGEYDPSIRDRVRDKALNLEMINAFQGLPEWLATYIVYNYHSEDGNITKWKTPSDIERLEQHSLRNPIVEQVINETLMVVRDIWKHFGNGVENYFSEIHVELGREMKNSKSDREIITRQVNENENTNVRIKALLIEMSNDENIENVRPHSPMQMEILKIYEEGVINAENDRIPEDILKISKQAQPSSLDLLKYKNWLQQKYRSPYTGSIIPLSKLFTPFYEIEHIIPQSRYFDDSFSNKVICESIVNGQTYKANQTGYEFIKNFSGQIVSELSNGHQTVKIFTTAEYENFVKLNYSKARGKMKRLLMEDIPDSFIQRQLNDSRYISKVIKNLMSNIVRDVNEQEVISKFVIVGNGTITSVLKQDWGLNDVWNDIISPRFVRLNNLTKSDNFGEWRNKEGKNLFQINMPLEHQKGFSKKRIDHRHHALDAIVIACTSRDHINFLNNETAIGKNSREEKQNKRYDLRNKLCHKYFNDKSGTNYNWRFNKPWPEFTKNCKESLNAIVTSFKQNIRIINKTVNRYTRWEKDNSGNFNKTLVKQTTSGNWAIRKPMHKDTVSGLVKLKFKKSVSLSAAIDQWEMITAKSLRHHIQKLMLEKYDKKKILAHFKTLQNKWEEADVSRVEIYYWDVDKEGKGNNAATRVRVDESFNLSMIKCITDTGIQKILTNHLKNYTENESKTENPDLAFSPDGLDKLNEKIRELNGGKQHKPVYKVRTFEPKGNKFSVGQNGNKPKKFVEAAKGTNLFFAIYIDENGNRSFETIPLNIAIERQKQGLSSVPESNETGHKLLMSLSPNDLVYVPDEGENINSIDWSNTGEISGNIYKMVSSTKSQVFFLPHTVAKVILDKTEFDSLNKVERALDSRMIKNNCVKLKIDRIGNLAPVRQNIQL